VDVLADLESEEERLEEILSSLSEARWTAPSAAAGWSVADVVLHLAQTEEMVVLSASGTASTLTGSTQGGTEETIGTVEEWVDAMVRRERSDPHEVFERWKKARVGALEALRSADPQRAMPWAAGPLKPRSLATTRLAEHWAHGLDITTALGVEFADTERLRHVAWLAHRTLPYSMSAVGETPAEVYCELEGPAGDVWCYGSPEAASSIRGYGGAFCRVGARRLPPEESGLVTSGPHGQVALRALRNYAF